MSREIKSQRSFRIPKKTLPLFLQRINWASDGFAHYEASFIFDCGRNYDVVVNEYNNHYEWAFNEIEKFAEDLKQNTKV